MACLRALSALGWVRQEDAQGNLFTKEHCGELISFPI